MQNPFVIVILALCITQIVLNISKKKLKWDEMFFPVSVIIGCLLGLGISKYISKFPEEQLITEEQLIAKLEYTLLKMSSFTKIVLFIVPLLLYIKFYRWFVER